MASGIITGNIATSSTSTKTKLQMKIEWSSKASEEKTNTSIVTTKLYGKRADSLSGATSGKNWSGKVQVEDEKPHEFSSMPKETSVSTSWVLFQTNTDEIEHEADGTKKITISGSLTGCTGTSLAGVTSSGSKEVELDTLHKVPDEVQYTMIETNQKLIDAGINDNVFVKDLSIKSFDISGNVYDGATIKEYAIFNRIVPYASDTLPLILDLSKYEMLTDLTYVSKIPITAQIIDSYDTAGYSETNLYEYIQYFKTKLIETSTGVKRNGQTSGKVKLNVVGNLFNEIVGNVDQTSYKPIIKYKFWKLNDPEPSTYDYVVAEDAITIEAGKFSVTGFEIGSSDETAANYFNPDYAYRVKVYVEDNFTSYESETKSIPVGEATWTEYKDRVDFKRITVKGNDIFVPRVGDILITSTNVGIEEMASRYGGTWELDDKEFKAQYIYSDNTTYFTRGKVSANGLRLDYSGHSITLNMNFTNNAQLSDTEVNIGTLNLSNIGVTALPHAYYMLGYTDGGNCVSMLNVTAAGAINCVDVIPDSYIASGGTNYFNVTFNFDKSQMNDEVCDKFYWKRIS